MINCFQTLLSNSTCATTTGEPLEDAVAAAKKNKFGRKPSLLTRMMTMTSASTKKSKVGNPDP